MPCRLKVIYGKLTKNREKVVI